MCEADDSPWWPDSFWSCWGAFARAQNLRVRLHDLRSTHGSLLLDKKVSPETVRQRLGHHSAAFFPSRYAVSLAGADVAAADTTDEVLSGRHEGAR